MGNYWVSRVRHFREKHFQNLAPDKRILFHDFNEQSDVILKLGVRFHQIFMNFDHFLWVLFWDSLHTFEIWNVDKLLFSVQFWREEETWCVLVTNPSFDDQCLRKVFRNSFFLSAWMMRKQINEKWSVRSFFNRVEDSFWRTRRRNN